MASSSKADDARAAAIAKIKTNPRGIPAAPFVANVEEHVGGFDEEVESSLRQFQDAIAKYKYMESNLSQRRRGLEEKIPDITKTLDMVTFLQSRREHKTGQAADDLDDPEEDSSLSKPMTTKFELNDTLYAHAELEDTDTVYLWLGANTMLSYTLTDAITLLSGKLASAQQALKNTIEDLEFLREQVTVMEVNTARVYNWDVKRRRLRREKEAKDKGES